MQEQLSFPIEKSQKEKIPQEIERKFLINLENLPPEIKEKLEKYPGINIKQGYISIEDEGNEARLRKEGNKFFLTVKNQSLGTREEIENEITKEQFEKIWPLTKGRQIEKTRYSFPYQHCTIYIDFYRGKLEGLNLAEIEFPSQEDAENFKTPEWLKEEVTENPSYYGRNLAAKEKFKEIPEYDLEKGVEEVVEMIQEKSSEKEGPIIVEIAGGSASGKTSAVAAKIKEKFGDEAIILSMDDYYRGKTFMEEEEKRGNILNWDQPEALNLPLLKEHLKALKEGKPIEKPVYDMKVSEPTKTETLKPSKIIIVEGLFALNDQIKEEGDVKAFVDIGTHGRILRRLLRDIERTGQQPADILKYFSEIVEPMHEKYVLSTKENADLIIKNEYSPKIEAERSGMHEIQIKFKKEVDEDFLRSIGAERLGTIKQIDTYYNPKDRNLIETDEMLRIREEGDRRILTYKGPKQESEFRKRPKFEFEIDKETEEKFLSIYGDKIKKIIKERTLYQLDGVIFSIDKVSKKEKDKEEDLGIFIEIRKPQKETNIENILSKLNLKKEEGIKKSYFEM